MQAGGRETFFLDEGCHGASTGWFEHRSAAIEDLDSEPKTFTLELDGTELGTRALALDCVDPASRDLELLVYRQNLAAPAGLGSVALVATIGLGATAGVLGATAITGPAPARRRRDGANTQWFPHDSSPSESEQPPISLGGS